MLGLITAKLYFDWSVYNLLLIYQTANCVCKQLSSRWLKHNNYTVVASMDTKDYQQAGVLTESFHRGWCSIADPVSFLP